MKKLTLIITLLFSTVIFSSTSYADWTKTATNPLGHTFYVDFDRIKKHGGYVYFWELIDYLKPNKYGIIPPQHQHLKLISKKSVGMLINKKEDKKSYLREPSTYIIMEIFIF